MAIRDPRSASSNARVIVPMRLSSQTLITAVLRELFKEHLCDNCNQFVSRLLVLALFGILKTPGLSGGRIF